MNNVTINEDQEFGYFLRVQWEFFGSEVVQSYNKQT